MQNTIYKADNFINNNIFYLFNRVIYEYDMKNAGYNLSKAYKLLPDKKIEELGRMKKNHRTIEIGRIQRSDGTFKVKLKKAFEEARRMFFEANKLGVNDVISIKKDAIFTTKQCKFQTFLEFIEFREKNLYTSYVRLNKRVEIYYSELQMDIKGLGKDCIIYHEDYMIHFIRLFFKKMETEDSTTVLGFLRRFVDKYKHRELDVGYYRRFDRDPYFDVVGDDFKYYEYWKDRKEDLDITYNYFEVLVKLIKIPL